MCEDNEENILKYFDSKITDRERAIFEGAITLGALYHQFVGTPIGDYDALTNAIRESALSHPYIDDAEVEIENIESEKKSPFDYPELTGKALKIRLTSEYGKARAELAMRRIPEIDYPLMFIEKVEETD